MSEKQKAKDEQIKTAQPEDPFEPVTRPLNASKLREEIRVRQKLDFDPLQPKQDYTGPTLAGKSLLKRLDTAQPPAPDKPKPDAPKESAPKPAAKAKEPPPDQTRQQQLADLERTRLAARSKGELINIIIDLKARLPETTGDLSSSGAQPPFDTAAILAGEETTDVARFLRLPVNPARARPDAADILWRVILKSTNAAHKPFGVELCDDVFVGRSALGIKPDLDLMEYGADRRGVSRQHAIIRPTKTKLLLVDLGSTNGTFHDGKRLRAGEPESLKNGDMIAFAGLRFSIRVVSSPD